MKKPKTALAALADDILRQPGEQLTKAQIIQRINCFLNDEYLHLVNAYERGAMYGRKRTNDINEHFENYSNT